MARLLLFAAIFFSSLSSHANREDKQAMSLEWVQEIESLLNQQQFKKVTLLLESEHFHRNSPEYFLLLGRANKGLGLEKQAELAFKSGILLSNRSSPQLLTELASLYFYSNSDKKAFSLVNEALTLDSNHLPALLLRVEIGLQNKDYDFSLSSIDSILRLEPRHFRAMLRKVSILVEMEDLPSALLEALNFLEEHPDSHHAKLLFSSISAQQNHSRESEQLLSDVILLLSNVFDKNDKYRETLLLSAVVNFTNHELALSRQQFEEFIDLYGDNVAASRYLSMIEYQSKDAEAAIVHIEKAIALAIDNSELYLLAAQYYAVAGYSDKQIRILMEALERFPNHDVVVRHLIAAHVMTENFDKALSLIKESEADQVNSQIMLSYMQLEYGQLRKVDKTVNLLLEEKPTDAKVIQLAAELETKKGNLSKAVSYYESILESDKGHYPALSNLASIYLKNSQMDMAEIYYQRLLEIDASDSLVNQLYADLLIKKRRYYRAIALLKNIETDNIHVGRLLLDLYIKTNEFSGAEALLENLLEKYSLDPFVLLSKSRLMEKQGHWKASREVLGLLFAVVYSDARRLTTVAHKQLDLNDKIAAGKTVQHLNDVTKNKTDTYLVARMALSDNNPQKAMNIAQRELAMAPNSRMWKEMKVHCLISLDQRTSAISLLGNLYEEAKKRPHLKLLAKLYLEQGYAVVVIDLLKDWLKTSPTDLWAVAQLSSVSASIGELDTAINALESFPQLDETPLFLNNLAFYYIERNIVKALKFAKRAYELAPQVAEVNDTLGWIYTMNDQPQKGLAFLKEAIAKDSKNADILYHLAYTLALLKDTELAKRSLQDALKLQPNHELADEVFNLIEKHQ